MCSSDLEPIAYEGSLKIKECAYVHAEGYSGGALKHGPFALIEDVPGKRATPIVCIILDDEHARLMKTVAHEVKARNAQLIVITDNPKLAEGLVHVAGARLDLARGREEVAGQRAQAERREIGRRAEDRPRRGARRRCRRPAPRSATTWGSAWARRGGAGRRR